MGSTQQGADAPDGVPLVGAINVGDDCGLGADACGQLGNIRCHGGQIVLARHVQHGLGFDVDHLHIVFQLHLMPGGQLRLAVNIVRGEQVNILLVQQMGKGIGGGAQV